MPAAWIRARVCSLSPQLAGPVVVVKSTLSPSPLCDGNHPIILVLEQFRHAQAHVSDGDDPDGSSTHVQCQQ